MSTTTHSFAASLATRFRRAGQAPRLTNAPRRATRSIKPAIVVGLLVALVAWNESLRRPIGPSGGSLSVPAAASTVAADQPAKFRIGTFNIHGGRGTDGIFDLERIAAALPPLDFIGLNEVHGDAPWESEDQATTLGRTLGMTPLFAPAEQRWRCIEFGNGLLTRAPVERFQVVPLERRHVKSHRNLVHARVRASNGALVNVVVTHVTRSHDCERREQLATVGNYFLSLAEPAVLLGDLNTLADDDALEFVLRAPGVKDALQEKFGEQTPRHIDWVLVRGATVTDAGLSGPGPSDHPYVWAELSVSPQAPTTTAPSGK